MPSNSRLDTSFGGAKVALFCSGRILVYRRDRKPNIPHPGMIDLPGGGREGEETPLQCVIREVEEEVGIRLSRDAIGYIRSYPSLEVGRPRNFFLAGSLSAEEVERMRPGDEGEEWTLMPVDEFLGHQNAIPFLKLRLRDYLTVEPTNLPLQGIQKPLLVSALFKDRLAFDIKAFNPTDVVSLLDPSIAPNLVPQFDPGVRVLQRMFFDGDIPEQSPPDDIVVGDIISFLSHWAERREYGNDARLLVHCHMGASRSTAVAYLALATLAGPSAEIEAFRSLLTVTNKPWPNMNVIRIADQLLNRGGALLAPLEIYRSRHPTRIDAYRRLNRSRSADSK